MQTLEDLDYTSGLVGPDVMADDDVRNARFVACQKKLREANLFNSTAKN